MSVSATQLVHGRYNRPMLGATLAFAAMSLFSMQDALVKWLTDDYWLIQLLFFRSIVIVLVMGSFLVLRGGRSAFHTQRKKDHALRTCFNFCAFVSYYFAVTRMPLSEVTAIALSAPLIMTALSGPLLGEHADMPRKMVLLTGFIGVLIVIQPTADNVDWLGVACALLGALMFALLALQTRRMSATESSELMVFIAASAFLIVTGLLLLFRWQQPNIDSLFLMFGLGVITVIAQYTIVSAYQFAAVYVIAPFEYVTILWAIALGWIVFSEAPTFLMLSGAALIVACGMAVVALERKQLRLER